MINDFIQFLKNTKTFGSKLTGDSINYSMLTSGGYRTYDKGRIIIIIFNDSRPAIIAKFYKSSEPISKTEFEIHNQFYELYGDLISKPLDIEKFNNYLISIEEPILGQNLSRYVYENLNEHTLQSTFDLILKFHQDLNAKLDISNFQSFEKEVKILFQQFDSLFEIPESYVKMIYDLKEVFLNHFIHKKIFQRYSNNDFIINNFIIADNTLRLIDFEFAKKTHFYFLEWFEFFRYQWIISNDYVFDLTKNKNSDEFYKIALQEFSGYQTNDKFTLSCRLIFEVFDFVKRFNISSVSTRKTLLHDMNDFLTQLSFRYTKPDLNNKNDQISSKESFYNSQYEKLVQYKQNFSELSNLRKVNEEYKSKLQATFENLDKLNRDLNEQKNRNEGLRREINRIISDHEAYRITIESSKIWKIFRNLDRLLGKNS